MSLIYGCKLYFLFADFILNFPYTAVYFSFIKFDASLSGNERFTVLVSFVVLSLIFILDVNP